MEKKGKPTYAGKIKNTGSQKVNALFPAGNSKGTVAKKGEDLRTGKAGK